LKQLFVEVDAYRKLRVRAREFGKISQIGHPHPQINLHQPKRERIRKNLCSNEMKRKFWTEPAIIPETIWSKLLVFRHVLCQAGQGGWRTNRLTPQQEASHPASLE
jgi:hypothetical protein